MDKISINIKNEEEEEKEEEEEEESEYDNYSDDEYDDDISDHDLYDKYKVFEDKELNDYINHTIWVDSLERKKLIDVNSFDTIYKTKIKATGQIIVSKIYNNLIPKDPRYFDFYLMFKRELIILSQISHPFIAKFIGYSPFDFKHRPHPIIFLEYCKNGSIRYILELEKKGIKIKAWNSTTKLINVYGIAAAMSYLHSLDIIHRDLTPKNVLLDKFLHPKLSGFELAKFLTDKTEEKTERESVYGTPAYNAPEIWKSKNYTKSSDVYAFGMVLYAIFTGNKPFEKLNNMQKLIQLLPKNFDQKLTRKFQKQFENSLSHAGMMIQKSGQHLMKSYTT